MTIETVVVQEGTQTYVWVEVFEIELDETTKTTGNISTRCWPELDDLREKVEAARAEDKMVSHLMRKDLWEETRGKR